MYIMIPPPRIERKVGLMTKLKQVWGYANPAFTGIVKFCSHTTEKTQWGKEQDLILCCGTYETEIEGKTIIVPFGNVAITRASLIGQIMKECGDDTDKWTGAVFEFKKGQLIKVSFEV